MKKASSLVGLLFLAGCAASETQPSSGLASDFHVFNLVDPHTFVFGGHRFDEATIGPALVTASEKDSIRIFVLRYPKSGMSLGTLKAVMPALSPGAKSCLYFQDEDGDVKQIAMGGVATVGDVAASSCPREDAVRSNIGPYSVPTLPPG